ncbi:hypothetical protein J3R82DRAFT_1930, partial [Butyriboletus roseoflavus]
NRQPDCLFFLTLSVCVKSCAVHVDDDELTIQTIRPVYDPMEQQLYLSGSFFTVSGSLCLETFTALRNHEEVEVTVIHDGDNEVISINDRKFFIAVVCPVDSLVPMDLVDEDVLVLSLIV